MQSDTAFSEEQFDEMSLHGDISKTNEITSSGLEALTGLIYGVITTCRYLSSRVIQLKRMNFFAAWSCVFYTRTDIIPKRTVILAMGT